MNYNNLSINDKAFANRFHIPYRTILKWIHQYKEIQPGDQILDFGCGGGITALRWALERKDTNVYGIDIVDEFSSLKQRYSTETKVEEFPDNINFQRISPGEMPFEESSFSLIYSWSVFEHINRNQLSDVIKKVYHVLKPRGVVFIQIDPLYYSSRGAHLYAIDKTPWMHLLHQHDNIQNIIKSNPIPGLAPERTTGFRAHSLMQYETLNKLTADELIEFFENNEFQLLTHKKFYEDLIPPKQLLRVYNFDVLTNNQVIAVFIKK